MSQKYLRISLFENNKKICPQVSETTIVDPTGFSTFYKRSIDPVWGDGDRYRLQVHGYPRTERDKGEGYTTYYTAY